MKRSILRRSLVYVTLAFLVCTEGLPAQTLKPITFKDLVNSLKTHGISNTELAQIVQSRGVEFELTPDKESELKAAGANAQLLAAVRVSYRGASSTAPSSAQPSRAPSAQPPHASLPTIPPQTSTASLPLPKKDKPPASASAPIINSIRDVKKLYIEKMPNDDLDVYLDVYIKSEILRQMPERLTVVPRREDADAIMTGTASDHKGSVTIFDLRGSIELWTGEAGDMGVFLTKVHGGEKKVAERLVSSLKKALQ